MFDEVASLLNSSTYSTVKTSANRFWMFSVNNRSLLCAICTFTVLLQFVFLYFFISVSPGCSVKFAYPNSGNYVVKGEKFPAKLNKKAENSHKPIILLWTEYYGERPSRMFPPPHNCPFECIFTEDRSTVDIARIRVLYYRDVRRRDLPPASETALNLLFVVEAPTFSYFKSGIVPSNFFNISMNYRSTADIPFPTDTFVPIQGNENFDEIFTDFEVDSAVHRKNKSVLIALSHCDAPSGRDAYIMELGKHIEITAVGRCYNRDCDSKCLDKLVDAYAYEMGDAEALRLEGNNHFKQKHYNKAALCYSRALEYGANSVILSNRSQAFLKLQSYEKAISDATEALKLDASSTKSLYRRAVALESIGFYERARIDFEKLLTLEPTNKEAAEAVNRLLNKHDTAVHKIRSFTKSESVQSSKPLASINIQTRVHPKDVNLEKISLNDARLATDNEFDDLVPNDVAVSVANDVSGEITIPNPPHNAIEFYSTSRDIEDVGNFVKYFLSIPLYEYENIFGELLEPDLIPKLINAFHASDFIELSALESLLHLSQLSRFELCYMMIADDVNEVLVQYLQRFGNNHSQIIEQIRIAYYAQ